MEHRLRVWQRFGAEWADRPTRKGPGAHPLWPRRGRLSTRTVVRVRPIAASSPLRGHVGVIRRRFCPRMHRPVGRTHALLMILDGLPARAVGPLATPVLDRLAVDGGGWVPDGGRAVMTTS